MDVRSSIGRILGEKGEEQYKGATKCGVEEQLRENWRWRRGKKTVGGVEQYEKNAKD